MKNFVVLNFFNFLLLPVRYCNMLQFCITICLLILYLFSFDIHVLQCSPPENSLFVDEDGPPPVVDMSNKPRFVSSNDVDNGSQSIYQTRYNSIPNRFDSGSNIPDVIVTRSEDSVTDLTITDSYSDLSLMSSQVAVVGYSDSSVNDSVNGLSAVSLDVNANSISSNIHELPADISNRSSIVVQDGSFVSDYHTDTLQYSGTNCCGWYDGQGFVAPDSAMNHPQAYDHTQNMNNSSNIGGIITQVRSNFNNKTIKFYGMGKRKLYWQVWEKHTDRFDSYKDFKKSWDPNTKFVKAIFKDMKHSVKGDFRDLIFVGDNKPINGRTSRDVNELLRKNRPFRR